MVLGRLDRLVQFALGLAQQLFGLGAVPLHVVMIGRARTLHLANRLGHVPVHQFQVTPVAHLGEGEAGKQRQCGCGDQQLFHQRFSKKGLGAP
jgi:hypothetical protein